MATDHSLEILKQLQQLSADDQGAILREIQRRSVRPDVAKANRSIMELEGLGGDIWAGVDAHEYVRRERESWNG